MMCKFLEWSQERGSLNLGPADGRYAVVREYEKARIPENVRSSLVASLKSAESDKADQEAIDRLFPAYEDESEEDGRFFRATGAVGTFPFRCNDCGQVHLLIVAPKVAKGVGTAGLEAFDAVSEMASYAIAVGASDGADKGRPKWLRCLDTSEGWSGTISGSHHLHLLLTLRFLQQIKKLARRDFRRYYVTVEDTLQARIKGKLQVSRYLNRWVAGKRLDMPCRWNEFTYDNWDNRILKSALGCCERWARSGSALQRYIQRLMGGGELRVCFDEVADIAPWELDFSKARLRSVSSNYREALNVAEQIIKHVNSATTSPPTLKAMWINTHELFEAFVTAIAVEACRAAGNRWYAEVQEARKLFKDEQDKNGKGPITKTDVTIFSKNTYPPTATLVIDAKYKELLEWAEEETVDSDEPLKKALCDGRINIINQDMYQLFFYLNSRGCNKGLIIYPFWLKDGNQQNAVRTSDEEFIFNVPEGNAGPYSVHLMGLNIAAGIHHVFERARHQISRMLRT